MHASTSHFRNSNQLFIRRYHSSYFRILFLHSSSFFPLLLPVSLYPQTSPDYLFPDPAGSIVKSPAPSMSAPAESSKDFHPRDAQIDARTHSDSSHNYGSTTRAQADQSGACLVSARGLK